MGLFTVHRIEIDRQTEEQPLSFDYTSKKDSGYNDDPGLDWPGRRFTISSCYSFNLSTHGKVSEEAMSALTLLMRCPKKFSERRTKY